MAWDFALLAKPQVSLPHGMDADRRHGTVSRVSFMLYQVPLGNRVNTQSELHAEGSWLRNAKSRNSHDVIIGSKQFCLTFALKGDRMFSILIGK